VRYLFVLIIFYRFRQSPEPLLNPVFPYQQGVVSDRFLAGMDAQHSDSDAQASG